MGREEKLLRHLRNNPSNVSFEELDKLLRWCGFESRSSGGSHYTYKRKGSPPITIPRHKPVKRVYVQQVLALIEQCCDMESDD
jgi:predicted RNA binding protein YcfA (HicA-like mRNA interferase family)